MLIQRNKAFHQFSALVFNSSAATVAPSIFPGAIEVQTNTYTPTPVAMSSASISTGSDTVTSSTSISSGASATGSLAAASSTGAAARLGAVNGKLGEGGGMMMVIRVMLIHFACLFFVS